MRAPPANRCATSGARRREEKKSGDDDDARARAAEACTVEASEGSVGADRDGVRVVRKARQFIAMPRNARKST